jgi:propanol-preferring alcohol dehydrogenase
MQAWEVSAPGPLAGRPLRLVERAAPVPRPGELLVNVRACGVCRTDLHVVLGELPLRRPRVIPGHQIVGVVAGTGERVGVPWLHSTCGRCAPCQQDKENLCDAPEFTGWTVDGGFAELVVVPAAFALPLPAGFSDQQAAPLLCAGIIGYRALRIAAGGDLHWLRGRQLGIYGFGAAGHVVLQLARAYGAQVHVCTRDRERHQALAAELSAASVGDTFAPPPVALDAAIVFAPAGEIVPAALRALAKGGRLVLGGIHMSPLPSLDYSLLYHERSLQSVANNTRADARAFLVEAARIPVRTQVQAFPFAQADRALHALAEDAVRGAAVIVW